MNRYEVKPVTTKKGQGWHVVCPDGSIANDNVFDYEIDANTYADRLNKLFVTGEAKYLSGTGTLPCNDILPIRKKGDRSDE